MIQNFRFIALKKILGFEYAYNFIKKVDKYSLKYIIENNGAILGKNIDIENGIVFHNCKNFSNLVIGSNVHIGKNCFFDLNDKIIIGNNVTIAMNSTFITHEDLGKSELKTKYPKRSQKIVIENDAYISVGCSILMGTTIGNHSIIAACSLVKNDVKPYTMVGGIPAKEIKKLE